MPSVVRKLANINVQAITGETSYALAA